MKLLIESSIICAVGGLTIYAFGRFVFPRLLAWRGVYMYRKTMFGTALVFDSEDAGGNPLRMLNVDGKFQSICYTDDELWTELTCAYHRHFADALFEAGWPDRVLVLGGGGFSFPKYLIDHDDVVRVDVAEIDPAIVDIARKHFFLDRLIEQSQGRLQVLIEDGWKLLHAGDVGYGDNASLPARSVRDGGNGNIHKDDRAGDDATDKGNFAHYNFAYYDVIVNDAFAGKRPLGPMGTAEGARIIHECLSNNGLYFANVISSLEGRHAQDFRETIKIFVEEFGYVYIFPERAGEPTKPGNNAFIAAERPLHLEGALAFSKLTFRS